MKQLCVETKKKICAYNITHKYKIDSMGNLYITTQYDTTVAMFASGYWLMVYEV